jgi:hypothetical protein
MLRQVTGTQIQRLHFADGASATRGARQNRVMGRLTEWGEIRRIPRFVGGFMRGSGPYIYTLAKSRVKLFDQHAYEIAELYVSLVEADRTGRLQLFEFSPEPYTEISSGRLEARPDAYVKIGTLGKRRHYFLEVDRATEWQTQLASKMHRYVMAYDNWQERTFPQVLFIVPDDTRARSIEAMAKRQRHPELFAVCLFDAAISRLASVS